MTWSGARFLDRERAHRAAGGDPERLQRLGWGDAPAPAPLAMLDPTGPRGRGAVACHWHPLRWMELEPDLEQVVDRFQCVQPKALTREDYDALSSFEVECWRAMADAHARETVRATAREAARQRRGAKKSRDAAEEDDA